MLERLKESINGLRIETNASKPIPRPEKVYLFPMIVHTIKCVILEKAVCPRHV